MTEELKANFILCLWYMGWRDVKKVRWVGQIIFEGYIDGHFEQCPSPDANFCAEVVRKLIDNGCMRYIYNYLNIHKFHAVEIMFASVETKLEILARIIEECGLVKEQL